MIKIETKYNGIIEIEENKVITFEHGLPGFPEENSFYIYPFLESQEYFVMQSLTSPTIAFVMTDPFFLFKDYSIKLSEADLEALQVAEKESLAIFCILTVKDPFQNTTANLQGPIVINDKEKIGKQIILNESNYKTKHLLFGSHERQEA